MEDEYELVDGPGPFVFAVRERLREMCSTFWGARAIREHYVRRRGELPGWLSWDQILAAVEHDVEQGVCHLRRVSMPEDGSGIQSGEGLGDDETVDGDELVGTDDRVPFEIHFVDELGDPITVSFQVKFTHDGEEQTVATDGSGVARIEYPSGSPFATVEVASPTDVGLISDNLRVRWNQAPRLTGRLSDVIEPGTDVDVLFLRFEPPEDSTAAPDAVAWRSELSTRRFRVHHHTEHVVSIQPYVFRARLMQMLFDTSKSFLLPDAIDLMRRVRELYDEDQWTKLLIVGHTDRSGQPSINDPLSLERAQSVAEYLTDDVDAWLSRYGADRPWDQRWGTREDHLMIQALADDALGAGNFTSSAPTLWYQEWHNALPPEDRAPTYTPLDADGVLGPLTRRQLVADYMNRDGTTLPPDVEIVTHGCGENFPVDESGDGIEEDVTGPEKDPRDRRVELYFFDLVMGVQPPPPGERSGPGTPQYPEWRARARRTRDFQVGARGQVAIRPASWFSYRRSFPKPSLFPALQQVAQRLAANPLSHLVIVGHTDTLGSSSDNHALSLARAEAVRALLTADVDDLLGRFDRPDPHEPWSWEEVQWLLHGVQVAGEPVYIGVADGIPGPMTQIALGVFQQSEDTLPVLYESDAATLERLVARYCEAALGDESPASPDRIQCVGAGDWHPPRPFGPLSPDWTAEDNPVEPWASAGLRRVELFVFDVAPSPAADQFPTSPGNQPIYDMWCNAVEEEITVPVRPCWIQVVTSDYRSIRTPIHLTSNDGGPGRSVPVSPRGIGKATLPCGTYVAEVTAEAGPERADVYHVPDETCGTLIITSVAPVPMEAQS